MQLITLFRGTTDTRLVSGPAHTKTRPQSESKAHSTVSRRHLPLAALFELPRIRMPLNDGTDPRSSSRSSSRREQQLPKPIDPALDLCSSLILTHIYMSRFPHLLLSDRLGHRVLSGILGVYLPLSLVIHVRRHFLVLDHPRSPPCSYAPVSRDAHSLPTLLRLFNCFSCHDTPYMRTRRAD